MSPDEPRDVPPAVMRFGRRGWRRRSANVAAICLGFVGLLLGLALGIPGRGAPGVLPTVAPASGRGPLVAFSRVSYWVFRNKAVGFGLVFARNGTYLAGTADGGQVWRLDGTRLLTAAQTGNSLPATTTRFGSDVSTCPGRTDCARLLIGPEGRLVVFTTGTGSSTVLLSSDNGNRWSTSRLPATIEDVVSVHNGFWALTAATARDGHGATLDSAPLAGKIWSLDGNGSWHLMSTLPNEYGPYQVLVRPSPSSVYALAPGEYDPIAGYHGHLVTSANGNVWQPAVSPCDQNQGPRFFDRVQFDTARRGRLWMICGVPGGGGLPDRTAVFRSSDAGHTWTTVASTIDALMYPGTFPDTSRVPLAGQPNVVVISGNDAWVILEDPSVAVESSDGGRKWFELPSAIERSRPLQVVSAGGIVKVVTASAVWDLAGGGWSRLTSQH